MRLKELVEKGYLVPKGQGRITPLRTSTAALRKTSSDDSDDFASALLPLQSIR
jgi:hypothetical protein